MKKERILLIGAGPHAKVVLDILLLDKEKQVVGLTDKNEELWGKKILEVPVLGNDSLVRELLSEDKIDSVILGLGYKLISVREKIYDQITKLDVKVATAIHPSATVAKSSSIGKGSVVMAGAVVNPRAKIEENCVVNTGAIIEHDVAIGKGCFVQGGANIAGSVIIGTNSVVGLGASIIEEKRVGTNSIIGAGAVVTEDVPDNLVVVGVPAKKLRRND